MILKGRNQQYRCVAALSICVVLLLGCSSTPIQQRLGSELQGLSPNETTVTEFRLVFPDSYLAGQSGDVSVYVVEDKQYAPYERGADPWSGDITQRLHFYFRDSLLLQWGMPGAMVTARRDHD